MEPTDGFQWAQANLDSATPDELQQKGLDVLSAPNLPLGERVVSLGDGRIDSFASEDGRPRSGYFVRLDELERYCREKEIPLNDVGGIVSAIPIRRR